MDFLQLAQERYSVRKFTTQPIEREVMDKILRAGYVAPTAHNLQPQRILVINSPEALEKMRRCTPCHFDAPTALLICNDSRLSWTRKFDDKNSGDIDCSIVTTHMMLEATALGVGVTWVMYFIPEAVREEFSLPEELEPVAFLMMGYPAPDAAPFPGHTEFRPLEELVSYNEF